MNPVNIAFRDLLFMLVLILAFFYSPDKKETQGVESPGNIIVAIRWPDDKNDVDLWVRNPMDKSVGFSAKDGEVFNLVRDDIGLDTDLSGSNFETSFSRGIPDGEYIVNVHCYRCDGNLPIPVTVDVKYTDKGQVKDIVSKTIIIKADNEEQTAIRFKMRDGKIVKGSENDIYQPIFRERKK